KTLEDVANMHGVDVRKLRAELRAVAAVFRTNGKNGKSSTQSMPAETQAAEADPQHEIEMQHARARLQAFRAEHWQMLAEQRYREQQAAAAKQAERTRLKVQATAGP